MFFYSEPDGQDEILGLDPIDPYFSNVSLLAKMDASFADITVNNHSPTIVGDATVSSVDSKYGGASALFDGSGDYVKYASSAATNLSGGDWTIEAWFKAFSLPGSPVGIFQTEQGEGAWRPFYAVSINSAGAFYLHRNYEEFAVGEIIQNDWNHVAIVNDGGTYKFFGNGQLLDSVANTTPNINFNFVLGLLTNWAGYSGHFNGYIDDFRVTKGVARYTANFTPPDSHPTEGPAPIDPYFSDVSLLLKMDTDFSDSSGFAHIPTIVGDATVSSADSKYGGASGYFDGTGDYVTFPTDTSLQFGSGDFTVEFWTKNLGKIRGGPGIFSNYSSYAGGGNSNGLALIAGHNSFNASNYLFVCGTIVAVLNVAVKYNTWDHFAITRQANTIKVFINGSEVYSGTHSGTVDGQGSSWFLGLNDNDPTFAAYNGYIDDFRVTKGVARYTDNFTPPDSLPTS